MVNLSRLFFIAYNTLLNNIPSFNTTAIINGIPIGMSPSYNNGTLTLQGSITIQSQANSILMEVYFGEYLIDTFNIQVQISPGTYTVVYVLTINDDTGIINNAIGYTAIKGLSSVSVSTNASSYTITLTQCMLTFYLIYSSYPSTVSITVKFSLSNGSTVTGSFQSSLPSLPQNTQIYYIDVPVTFY
jgi:hypothetical protein